MTKFKKQKKSISDTYGLFSNFCGPGGYGIPRHIIDEICAEHDYNYGLIMSSGDNPYTHYNWADAKMQQRIRAVSYGKTFSEKLVAGTADLLWEFKKQFTSHLTNSPESDTSTSSTIDSDFSLDEPMSKRTRFDNLIFKRSNITDNMDTLEQHVATDQPDTGKILYAPYVRPNYFTAKLPYFLRVDNLYGSTTASAIYTSSLNKFKFILNGIYNIPSITSTTAYTFGSNMHYKPNGRDLYVKDAAVTTNRFNFDYYKVLGAEVTITFHTWGTGNESALFKGSGMAYGIAIDALDETEEPSKNTYEWKETPGVKCIDMYHSDTHQTRVEKISYSPNMDRDRIRVKLDTNSNPVTSSELTLEGWTAIGKNPDYLDSVKIFSKPIPAMAARRVSGTTSDYKVFAENFKDASDEQYCHDFVEVRIEYIVQFRESKSLTTWDTSFDT